MQIIKKFNKAEDPPKKSIQNKVKAHCQ